MPLPLQHHPRRRLPWRLLVGEGQIQIDDLRDFAVSNVRLAFPRFPPGAAIAGTMLLQLRIVVPRRFPFVGLITNSLQTGLLDLVHRVAGKGTFAGLNPLPAVHMY